MGSDSDQILHVTIWNKDKILHRHSCIAASPNCNYIVTGSVDGNVCIWEFRDKTLELRTLLSGRGDPVTTIACFEKFFVAFYGEGTTRHFDLPHGNLFTTHRDAGHIHTNSSALGQNQIVCSGYYPDLLILDALSLQIVACLQSRLQSDWVSCFKVSSRDKRFYVQAITFTGVLKTWSFKELTDHTVLESSSGPLNIRQCLSMSFHMKRRLFLLVTINDVTVFDRGITNLFHYSSTVPLGGGDFIGEDIAFWTRTGDVYVTCLDNTTTIKKVISGPGVECIVPMNSMVFIDTALHYVVGDVTGGLSIYSVDTENVFAPVAQVNLGNLSAYSKGLLDYLNVTVTSSTHVTKLNRFITGCADGSLLLFNAIELLYYYFINEKQPHFDVLSKHQKAVRCILYPHAEMNSYQESLLVTGSDDFSVCLWDICKLELIHQFCVHSGPIVRLLRPPTDTNFRVNQAICSVSADHSVAILSIRERRCTFLAGHHPFPIVAIRWKPFHDFMVIKCFDGAVFVWEIKTGVLDRVVTGIGADEVIYNCDEDTSDVLWDFYTNGPHIEEVTKKPLQVESSSNDFTLQLRGVMCSFHAEFQVLSINLTKLVTLLELGSSTTSDQDNNTFVYLTKPPNLEGLPKRLSGLLSVIKHEAEVIQGKFHMGTQIGHQNAHSKVVDNSSLGKCLDLVPTAVLVLSILHLWGRDEELDQYYRIIGGEAPKRQISIDLVSRQDILPLCPPLHSQTRISISRLVALTALSKSLQINQSSSIEIPNSLVATLPDLESIEDVSHVEKLAALWQTSSSTVRSVVRIELLKYLMKLKTDVSFQLLNKWRTYLPLGFTKDPFLSRVAIVIIGLLTIDWGICNVSDDIFSEYSKSLRFCLSSGISSELQAVAVDMVGRGFLFFEDLLPVDDVVVLLLDLLSNQADCTLRFSAQSTLRIIANARIDKFFAFLKFVCKTSHSILESSKAEIISIVRDVLANPPCGISSLLSDVIEVLISCIDQGHLRASELVSLLPGIGVLNQVDHSLIGQRVAVGIPDGKVVVHDLRFHRSHVFQAHTDDVLLLRFSPDGKLLITINRKGESSLWQLSHGLFDLGVGQFRFRCIKQFSSELVGFGLEGDVIIHWKNSHSITIERRDQVGSSATVNLSY